MLSCEEVTRLCSEEMERPLSWHERLSLRWHLRLCSGCTNFRVQMRVLRRIMRRYAGWDEDPHDGPPT